MMPCVKYHIREMLRDDLDEVAALEAACFSMPWKYRDFEEILTNPDRVYLLAESEDMAERILGGCVLSNAACEGDISNVAVLEKYRGQKIAENLMAALLALGRERYGMTEFTLEVRSKNVAAHRLYEKCGFVALGVRPNFYDKPKDDAVIMKLIAVNLC